MRDKTMRNTILEALSDNIVIDKDKCIYCGTCVETCILDNLRMKLAPCSQGCPLKVNVQGYVQETLRGNDAKARDILRKKLIFPEILGRICPAPCEDTCHHNQVDGQAVSARAIKRYLTEGQSAGDIPLPEKAPASGKKVAVVGSGPAGLQAAHDLIVQGHEVVVLESGEHPGGMLRWAIPEFRLPGEVLDRELTLFDRLGITYMTGIKVGRSVTLDELQKDYDAVVLAAGCCGALNLGVEGEDLANVHAGLELLKNARSGNAAELSGKVVVIGGGNVAVDAAQAALRLGAEEVTLVSLETGDQLPAFKQEVAHAREAGVKFQHSWGPLRILGKESVSQVELQRCLAVFDEDGKFAPSYDECTLNTIEADHVVVAIGQKREGGLGQGLGGIDPLTLQAGDSNLFVAGDWHTGPSSVVSAMASGREAAESINRMLAGEHLKYGRAYAGPIETGYDIDTSRGTDAPRAALPHNKCGGKGDFSELEQALSGDAARIEAGRCYSCGQPFGKYRTCWFCLPCEVECPEDALWVEIPYLLR
jgi:NADPH-dependent glutamate synthase beta subunit-like oxidoreductase